MTEIHKMARRRPRRRRAFVLLIILSMLALLVIFMVTFIIVAGQYRSAAVSSAKSTMLKDDPRKTLDSGAYQLFRDTNDPGSVLRGHSLLRDMYGASVSTTIKATVAANAPTLLAATGGQFLQFEITPFASISPISGYYNGCVLTPVSGAAKGRSMRIVGYSYSSGPPIQAFVRTFLPAGTVTGNSIPAVNDQIVINGQAFSGKGLGYDPETGKSDLRDYGLDGVAGTAANNQWLWPGSDDGWSCLFPNRQGEAAPAGYTSTGTKVDIASEGMNESYDAVDFQNMALGAILFNDTNLTTPTFIEPSFHRTALVDFWFKYISKTFLPGLPAAQQEAVFLNPLSPSFASIPLPTRMNIAYIKSRIMMRPSTDSNPNFTGSNPAFNPFGKGLWDVDNDNDGIPDSIWIDLGLPAVADRDGRLAKPLFALLCLDLDNKLNVNTHGTFAHFGNLGSLEPSKLVLPAGTPWAAALANMPKGMGYGPPEIDLRAVLSTGTAAANILTGVGAYTGRYGLDQRPGNGPMVLDVLTKIKYFDYPPNYSNYFNPADNTSYQSPPDLTAEGQFGLDYVGQPNCTTTNVARLDVRTDNPYEFDPSSNPGNDVNGKDTPFSASELERVLRAHDRDVSLLPQRLLNVTDAAAGTGILGPPERELNRQAITTDSYDLPVPNVVRPRDWVGNPPRTAAELICFRVAQAMGAVYQANPAVFNSRISYELSAVTTTLGTAGNVVNVSIPRGLLAPELLMNVRMDVNRPFGNGLDDNGNLIVDEHWQHLGGRVAAGGLLVPPPWLTSESGGLNPAGDFINEAIWLPTIPTNLDNDSRITSDSNHANRDRDEFLARQHYARNLYVLMMALKPASFHFNYDGKAGTPAEEQEEDARILAQWAVNAVDFRDADSIMTPFEYDVNPFTPHPGPDGAWGVKGVDDDGANGTDDPGEALYPGSDDCLWCVDGILGNTGAPSEDDDPTNPAYASRRRVVWGTERPELLITETLAVHDKRTTMSSATPPQPEQRLRPRGGFFVELYNPWTSTETRRPAEFYSVYDTSSSAFVWTDGVVLNKSSGSPVWRLLVTEVIVDADTTLPLTDADKFYPNEYPPITAPAKAENRRVIYFTAGGPELSPAGKAAYHAVYGPATSIATSLRIKPGRYAVIGTQRDFISLPDPAEPSTNYMAGVCNLGRNKLAAEGVDLMKADTRRIVLRDGFNNGMTSCDPDLGRVYVEDNEEATIPALLPHPVISSPPSGYVADELPPIGVRVPNLEISEENYTDEGWVPATAGDDTREGEYVPPKNPVLDPPELVSNINYRRVYLQRLANPVLPYDAITNPYRTVDSMPVPLYVFEGVRTPTSEPPDDFITCEREDNSTTRELWTARMIAAPVSDIDTSSGIAVPDHYFARVLKHTLGFLNEPNNPLTIDTNTDGILDRRDRFILDDGSNAALANLRVPNDYRTNAPLAEYVGGPNARTGNPFPWLTWLNRPFVSPYELMLVPRERSGKLLSSFNLGAVANFYNPAVKPDTTPVRFGHLLPLLGTSSANPASPTELGADLYKVFDLLQVPSRFVGTETWLDPALFTQVVPAGTNGTEFFHPPFNRISNFRDPGKINLNTLYDSRIWKAIQGNLNVTAGAAETATMSDLIKSRLGTGGATMMDTNGLPTLFANPLRSADAGGLVPFTQESLAQLKSVISAQASASGNAPLLSDAEISALYMERPNVECTLLRSGEIAADATKPFPTQPTRFAANAAGQFMLATEDISRNPYFALSPVMRLPNLVTTRSNVYATWITVGYFEYDAATGQIGQEIGADTGSIKRHRAFYIFDRSIPVAFEAGKNHNVDRAVMVRRVIE